MQNKRSLLKRGHIMCYRADEPNTCPRCGKLKAFSGWAIVNSSEDFCLCDQPLAPTPVLLPKPSISQQYPDETLGNWNIEVGCPKCEKKLWVHRSELTFLLAHKTQSVWLFVCPDCTYEPELVGRVVVLDSSTINQGKTIARPFSIIHTIDISQLPGENWDEVLDELRYQVEDFFNLIVEESPPAEELAVQPPPPATSLPEINFDNLTKPGEYQLP